MSKRKTNKVRSLTRHIIAYEATDEGLVAFVSGPIAPFSFLVGAGEINATRVGDIYLWSVHNELASYSLQLALPSIPKDALNNEDSPTEILLEYASSEIHFQESRVGRKIVGTGIAVGQFPTGELFAVWAMEGGRALPLKTAVIKPVGGVRFRSGEKKSEQATSISVHAATIHFGSIIMLSLQGFGANWNLYKLETKIQRIMLSLFRHS